MMHYYCFYEISLSLNNFKIVYKKVRDTAVKTGYPSVKYVLLLNNYLGKDMDSIF